MKILDHTGEHQPTYLRDVIESLVGKEVIVFGHYAITGKLVAYNGYVLHVQSTEGESRDYCILGSSVEAIATRPERS